ncbi:MAG TPA: GNAT family N-acetyltransferase [Thermoanaerobaculia bacterium]|nr:GNAT family N-acetyltransferase [Thermoanaerobaculia bacterium]
MTFRTLTDGDFDAVLEAFSESFSDYVVPFAMTADQLREICARRGVRFDLSVGAFDGDRLVAFTLNGFDGGTAYDSGTGVVPTHRRQGLARGMMDFIVPHLRAAGAQRYLLEVIQTNTRALRLYESLGFTTTRSLTCWKFENGEVANTDVSVRLIEPDWNVFAFFRDVEPSWQNSDASMIRARAPRIVLGAFDDDLLTGYAIVFPLTHDLAQLAVRRSHRCRGIGLVLLARAIREAGGNLRALNIDARDEGIAAFLRASGGTLFVEQFEMSRAL